MSGSLINVVTPPEPACVQPTTDSLPDSARSLDTPPFVSRTTAAPGALFEGALSAFCLFEMPGESSFGLRPRGTSGEEHPAETSTAPIHPNKPRFPLFVRMAHLQREC